jgi:hypothetical protein
MQLDDLCRTGRAGNSEIALSFGQVGKVQRGVVFCFFKVDGVVREVASDGVLIWRFAIECFLDLMTSTLFYLWVICCVLISSNLLWLVKVQMIQMMGLNCLGYHIRSPYRSRLN